MSTGYGWEGLRQVCTTLLGAHHVPERFCGGACLQRGAITSVRPLPLPLYCLCWMLYYRALCIFNMYVRRVPGLNDWLHSRCDVHWTQAGRRSRPSAHHISQWNFDWSHRQESTQWTLSMSLHAHWTRSYLPTYSLYCDYRQHPWVFAAVFNATIFVYHILCTCLSKQCTVRDVSLSPNVPWRHQPRNVTGGKKGRGQGHVTPIFGL